MIVSWVRNCIKVGLVGQICWYYLKYCILLVCYGCKIIIMILHALCTYISLNDSGYISIEWSKFVEMILSCMIYCTLGLQFIEVCPTKMVHIETGFSQSHKHVRHMCDHQYIMICTSSVIYYIAIWISSSNFVYF